jgi:hypothetical protein
VISLDNVKRLRDAHRDGQRDTYKSHFKVMLIYFKAVPVLKETHPEAYKAWEEMATDGLHSSHAPSSLQRLTKVTYLRSTAMKVL